MGSIIAVKGQMIGSIIWLVVLFAIMYFLLIRPQQKEQKERAEMIRSLKPGDKIVTMGGLIGVITKVEDLSVKVRVAEKVEVDVLKTGVARVLNE
ncbi:MAG TPA: preprotein translocase subunit YajC [Bacillota bacterium]|nr:preprotein translocase subunit YajC [Bacillota bacterium]HOK63768.1 preprotein translocase subunit YajC [Bacillota bacterium]HOL11544.1 preprotein translocase subunit YajC [Bacillota bacterium]HOQ02601.1 preprotein translocase subunit YajC [Bacillota bacterium]HPP60315.1 preprotein translocase subunit YajC [Bacillota bacterium]